MPFVFLNQKNRELKKTQLALLDTNKLGMG